MALADGKNAGSRWSRGQECPPQLFRSQYVWQGIVHDFPQSCHVTSQWFVATEPKFCPPLARSQDPLSLGLLPPPLQEEVLEAALDAEPMALQFAPEARRCELESGSPELRGQKPRCCFNEWPGGLAPLRFSENCKFGLNKRLCTPETCWTNPQHPVVGLGQVCDLPPPLAEVHLVDVKNPPASFLAFVVDSAHAKSAAPAQRSSL